MNLKPSHAYKYHDMLTNFSQLRSIKFLSKATRDKTFSTLLYGKTIANNKMLEKITLLYKTSKYSLIHTSAYDVNIRDIQ